MSRANDVAIEEKKAKVEAELLAEQELITKFGVEYGQVQLEQARQFVSQGQ